MLHTINNLQKYTHNHTIYYNTHNKVMVVKNSTVLLSLTGLCSIPSWLMISLPLLAGDVRA